jgi:hypothetical protein
MSPLRMRISPSSRRCAGRLAATAAGATRPTVTSAHPRLSQWTASTRRPVLKLHVGLDLSRRRLDVCLLDERGGLVAEPAVPPDADGLCGLAGRLAGAARAGRDRVDERGAVRARHAGGATTRAERGCLAAPGGRRSVTGDRRSSCWQCSAIPGLEARGASCPAAGHHDHCVSPTTHPQLGAGATAEPGRDIGILARA